MFCFALGELWCCTWYFVVRVYRSEQKLCRRPVSCFLTKRREKKVFFLLHVLPQVSQRSPTIMLTLVFPPLCILIIIRWLWILVLQTSKHRQLQYSYQWKIFFISFFAERDPAAATATYSPVRRTVSNQQYESNRTSGRKHFLLDNI